MTTDEDWQQKAVYQPPGTYYVVANSESFIDGTGNHTPPGISNISHAQRQLTQRSNANTPVDNDTVILGSFEEGFKRSPIEPSLRNPQYRARPTSSRANLNLRRGSDPSTRLMPQSARPLSVNQSENELIHHWRSYARKQLFELDVATTTTSMDTEDLIEIASHSYLPVRMIQWHAGEG